MSKSEFKRLVTQRNGALPKEPTGKVADLPSFVTTMWPEKDMLCPNDKTHPIAGSSNKVYCYECGIWWQR